MARLLVWIFPQSLWHLIIDDTLIRRSSKKVPGSKIYREHSRKSNRPEFVQGQCWVSLAAVIEKRSVCCCHPDPVPAYAD
jgi:hypothetical protein